MSVPISAPPTAPCCLLLVADQRRARPDVGPEIQHSIVFDGRCLACLPIQQPEPEDDRGDRIVKQSGGLKRDRYQRVVR